MRELSFSLDIQYIIILLVVVTTRLVEVVARRVVVTGFLAVDLLVVVVGRLVVVETLFTFFWVENNWSRDPRRPLKTRYND